METWPSAQYLFQKLNFGNSSQKARKSRYQNFLVLSSFTGFIYFIPNILSKIVVFRKDLNPTNSFNYHQRLKLPPKRQTITPYDPISHPASNHLSIMNPKYLVRNWRYERMNYKPTK